MALNDVIVVQQSGGLGRRLPATDGICGLITNGVAIVGGVQYNKPYRLNSLADAADLLIDADYDVNNDVLVYENIKDFFRMNIKGELWLLIVDETPTYLEMVTDNTEALVVGSNGAVKFVSYSYNTLLTGIPGTAIDLELVIAAAQTATTVLTDNHFPCSALVEMVGFTTASNIDFRAKNARRVTAVVGQNYAIAQDPTTNNRCAIGLALGTVSLAKVHENIAWVQKFNLLGDTLNKASIGGTEISQLTMSVLNTINDHGLLFIRSHANISGLYWNDSPTCITETDDFAYIENNRTIDKATRIIRTAFLPHLNSPIYVDPSTGTLAPNVVAMLENVGSKTMTDEMFTTGEVSGFTFTIDPFQDILATSQLEAVLEITPVGTARNFIIKIGFKNPFNS